MIEKNNLTFRVPAELKQKFVEEAKANGTTATALFHQWMEEYVSRKKLSTDAVSADSTYSTDTAHTDSTYSQLVNRLEELEEDYGKLLGAQTDHSQKIHHLQAEVEKLKASTYSNDTAHTNNESHSIGGGSEGNEEMDTSSDDSGLETTELDAIEPPAHGIGDSIADSLPDKISQRQLGEAYGFKETTFRDYLKGKSSPADPEKQGILPKSKKIQPLN